MAKGINISFVIRFRGTWQEFRAWLIRTHGLIRHMVIPQPCRFWPGRPGGKLEDIENQVFADDLRHELRAQHALCGVTRISGYNYSDLKTYVGQFFFLLCGNSLL
jgi:hypothetical protein